MSVKLSYYDVKVESMVPATLIFKVLAESPEQAAELSKSKQPNQVQYKLNSRRDSKLTVYDLGSCVIKFMKRLI